MAEGGIEEAVEKIVQKPTTRRNLLKWVPRAAAAGAIAASIGIEESPNSPYINTSPATKLNIPKPPENLPDDVLSEKELQRYHIRIDPTEDTQLFLRRSALEMPIFKNAVENKNGGVVISLIDNESLTWNAIDKLPPDARLMWQAKEVHPSEYPQSFWKQYFKIKEQETQESINHYQDTLSDIASGKAEIKIQENINEYRNWIEKAKSEAGVQLHRESLAFWQKQLEDLKNGKLEPKIKDYLKSDQKKLEDIQKLKGKNQQSIIQYFINKEGAKAEHVNGQLVESIAMADDVPDPMDPFYKFPVKMNHPRKRYNYLKNQRPAWLNKTYIYICVGNNERPHPDQSYLGPNDFEVDELAKKVYGYHVKVKESMASSGFTPGMTLRHEFGHYGNTPDQKFREREAGADDFVLQGFLNAWQKYQQTGDTSGYSLIFATKEGLTFTKNQQVSAPEAV